MTGHDLVVGLIAAGLTLLSIVGIFAYVAYLALRGMPPLT